MQDTKQHTIYFVSGVCGVGKTSTMVHLKKNLDSAQYDIRDIDERGVPDGGGLTWLSNETRYWLDVAKENARNGKNTIICGFANPELFKDIYKEDEDIPAQLILLNASQKTLEQRLRGRHSTPETIREIERASGAPFEEFIKNTVEFAPKLRGIFEREGLPIVETDNKTPEEVGEAIVEYLEGE